jgi:hypothetical protein
MPAVDQQSKNDTLPGGSPRDDSATAGITPGGAVGAANQQMQFLQNFKKQWEGLSRSQKEQYVKQLPADQLQLVMNLDKSSMMPDLSVSAAPPRWSVPWFKQKGYDLLGHTLQALPAIGGGLGAWGGGTAGGAVGTIPLGPVGTLPGVVTGEVVGAGIGGGIGESARQGAEHLLGWDKNENYTAAERWKEIGLESVYNSLGQLFGIGLGKAMGSTPERVGAKLAFAGGLGHGADALGPSNVSVILPDLIALEKQMPVKDTKDLANLVTTLKRNIGQQVDMAYARPVMQGGRQVALGKATANTGPLVNRLDGIIQQLSINPDINAAAIREVQKVRAFALTPRTYEQLADWRIRINDEIGSFYEMNPGAKRIAMNTNPDLAAKKELADAIRDVTYPEMDSVSGQPLGTTAVLQKKRGITMEMENQVRTHRKTLLEKSAVAAGESPLKRGNFSVYVTGSGRPGGALHKVKNIVRAPNVLADADTRAASAFGHTLPQKVARAATNPAVRRTAAGASVYPLARDTQRPTDTPEAAPPEAVEETQPAPLPALKAEAAQRSPTAPPKKNYWQTATGPNGHKIGTDDGVTWFDVETGQQIQ